MRLLLDTHALLWALADPDRLPPALAEAIRSRRNAVHVSAASTWELIIKAGLGRIELPRSELETVIAAAGLAELPVTIAHSVRLRDLPRHHRDPFDRILVAQALEEDLTLVSRDSAIRRYAVRTLWA